ncbi:MAG: hypothetical protein JSV92_00070 [archaeon]|nr:MAG: hypothetical protein JSV92_00070 [archaeon]
MIISAKKILELNKKYRLIENLAERELNPEGLGIDIRAGGVYRLGGEGFLGIEDRETPKISKMDGSKIVLNPGDYVLVKTMERINVPRKKITVDGKRVFLMPDVYPRSTLQRSGIYLMATKTDPGYHGELTFAMANLGGASFKLEIGARIANLVFKCATGDLSREYGGQWKGGRVSTKGREKQI